MVEMDAIRVNLFFLTPRGALTGPQEVIRRLKPQERSRIHG
jgi:hypothetical protein